MPSPSSVSLRQPLTLQQETAPDLPQTWSAVAEGAELVRGTSGNRRDTTGELLTPVDRRQRSVYAVAESVVFWVAVATCWLGAMMWSYSTYLQPEIAKSQHRRVLPDAGMVQAGEIMVAVSGCVLAVLLVFMLARRRMPASVSRQQARAAERAESEPVGCWQLCKRFGGWVAAFVAVCSFVSVPVVAEFMLLSFDSELHHIAIVICAIFTAVACFVSFREIIKHLQHFSMARVQVHICRILLMVPIYSLDCIISLRQAASGFIYWQTLRELYEAYAVYNFMALMLEFLHNVATDRDSTGQAESAPPGSAEPPPTPGQAESAGDFWGGADDEIGSNDMSINVELPPSMRSSNFKYEMPAAATPAPIRTTSRPRLTSAEQSEKQQVRLNRLERVAQLLQNEPPQPHLGPMRLVFNEWQMGAEFLQRCRYGAQPPPWQLAEQF